MERIMICTPKMPHIPFDVAIMGGAGYVLGQLTQSDAKLSCAVSVATSLANYIFFGITNRWILPSINRSRVVKPISSEALYTATNLIVSIISVLAAEHLKIISRTVVGVSVFISAAVLIARIRILHEN